MRVIVARNVNEAYKKGLRLLADEGVPQTSRAGDVLVTPFPVTTVYKNPRERVLFDDIRDANPFFHLMESLWMLAGRNDATWLDNFIADFSKRFAETNGTQHGAYGFRWRSHFMLDGNEEDVRYGFELDQLGRIIRMLRANPNDRRVVLQMWDPEIDLGAAVADVPCNLCVLPRIVNGKLDITVTCRSNDAIWGAYGANAVHFSVLQEYLAAHIGVPVGTYYQISNNFHAYTRIFNAKAPAFWLNSPVRDNYARCKQKKSSPDTCYPAPIVTHPENFDEDLARFFGEGTPPLDGYVNPFFENIAVPMFYAYRAWREDKNGTWLDWLNRMYDPRWPSDWYIACRNWFEKRLKLIEKRAETTP